MTTTLDCDAMPVLQIKTHRQKSGKLETSHYKVTISRLRAHLSIKISYNSLKGDMTVEGYPDVSTYFIFYILSILYILYLGKGNRNRYKQSKNVLIVDYLHQSISMSIYLVRFSNSRISQICFFSSICYILNKEKQIILL